MGFRGVFLSSEVLLDCVLLQGSCDSSILDLVDSEIAQDVVKNILLYKSC